jgi:hypothetical protein
MTPREWLEHLGALMVPRSPKIRPRLMTYHSGLKTAVPSRWLTPDLARAVEPRLLALPSYDELITAIRREADLMAIDTGGEKPDPNATEDEQWAVRWYDYACRRIAETPDRKGHLLSLLRAQSMPAWRKFAAVHAPEVLAAHDEIEREIADRRAGLLPPLPNVHVPSKAAPPAFKRSHAPGPTSIAPRKPNVAEIKRRSPDDAFNALLAKQAAAGDATASARLLYRTGRHVDPGPAMDEREFAPADAPHG